MSVVVVEDEDGSSEVVVGGLTPVANRAASANLPFSNELMICDKDSKDRLEIEIGEKVEQGQENINIACGKCQLEYSIKKLLSWTLLTFFKNL